MKTALALILTSGLVLICCSVVEPDCPFPATSCPSSCFNIDASELDRDRQCRVDVLLGCSPGGSRPASTGCAIHESGRIVLTQGDPLASKPGWRRCTGEEEREIINTSLCSDYDGGRKPAAGDAGGSADVGAE